MEAGAHTYNVYFAGSLFDAQILIGNSFIAQELLKQSGGMYNPVLPQSLEQRVSGLSYADMAASIRATDLLRIATADLLLINYNGAELDAGTVVEATAAHMLNIPAAIIRSDFRTASDGAKGFNLMADNWPRSTTVQFDSMQVYQNSIQAAQAAEQFAGADTPSVHTSGATAQAAEQLIHHTAAVCKTALDTARAIPAVCTHAQARAAYQLFAKTSGIAEAKNTGMGSLNELCEAFEGYFQAKVAKGIYPAA